MTPPGTALSSTGADSLDACGCTRDRHTTIGAGAIGTAPSAELLGRPAVAGVPVAVGTPSADGGHARDIALLTALRDGALLAA